MVADRPRVALAEWRALGRSSVLAGMAGARAGGAQRRRARASLRPPVDHGRLPPFTTRPPRPGRWPRARPSHRRGRAELTGRPQRVPERLGRAHVERRAAVGVGRRELRAVPQDDSRTDARGAHRQARTERGGGAGHPSKLARQGPPTRDRSRSQRHSGPSAAVCIPPISGRSRAVHAIRAARQDGASPCRSARACSWVRSPVEPGEPVEGDRVAHERRLLGGHRGENACSACAPRRPRPRAAGAQCGRARRACQGLLEHRRSAGASRAGARRAWPRRAPARADRRHARRPTGRARCARARGLPRARRPQARELVGLELARPANPRAPGERADTDQLEGSGRSGSPARI